MTSAIPQQVVNKRKRGNDERFNKLNLKEGGITKIHKMHKESMTKTIPQQVWETTN